MKATTYRPGYLLALSIFVGLLTLSLFFSSCSKDKTDKIDAPAAIKEMIKNFNSTYCFCDPIIKEYVWRGDTVYVFLIGGPNCDGIPTIYNSDGQVVLRMNVTYSLQDFLQESIFIRDVWTCKG